ncbi:MAG: Epimerase family protein [Opitutia bacterium UBA7350]|nr:MAG: Epimerase family protein [Opitutae bacterium UBA7350]
MLMQKKILVTGASGLIGQELCKALEAQGHRVQGLARGSGPGCWDPSTGFIDTTVLEGVDTVVHLAGENVAQRWTRSAKREIRDSRVKGTKLLMDAMLDREERPDLIMASGINYYGFADPEVKDEQSPLGKGFLASVCRDWEATASPWPKAGGRLVMLRTGIVLSAKGGALAKMLPPFRLGLGGTIGNGRQRMSWISIEDIVAVYLRAVEDKALKGPVNAVAPNSVSGTVFAQELGAALNRPTWLPTPAFALRLAFGVMAKEVILSDMDIKPRALEVSGFTWRHLEIRDAFRSILQ